LIDAGADCDITDEKNNTLLQIAVINQNEDIVKLFLDKNDINARNSEGKTPLLIAVENGNAEIADALIEAGADFGIIDENGNTFLHIAISDQNEAMINLLIDKIDLNAKNAEGKTSIDIAEENENYSLLVRVYYSDGDIEKAIKYGESAIEKNSEDADSKYFLSESLLKKATSLKKADKLKETVDIAGKANTYCSDVLTAKPEDENVKNLSEEISGILTSIKKCDSCNGTGSVKCVICGGSGSVTKTRTAFRTAYRMEYDFYSKSYHYVPYTEYYQVPYTEYYQESYQQPYTETYTESCPITQTCSTCKGEGWVLQ